MDAAPVLESVQRIPCDLEVPALYAGVVAHTRAAPLRNRFRYRSFYWLTDVDAPVPRGRFPTTDHDEPRAALADAGVTADRILRLAHARSLGHGFNPLTVYWCYLDGALVAAIAEVHNTYGGRHSYLLRPDANGRASVAKQLYVSPFYPVAGSYDFRISAPGRELHVSVTYRPDSGPPFLASLVARVEPPHRGRLIRLWTRHPATAWRTSALIRWQGIRLWSRGLPVHPR